MIEVIPTLEQCVVLLGFSIGYLFGEGGSNFDGDVKYGFGKKWFNSLNPVVRYLVDLILNATHHFQYGLVAIIIGHTYLSGMEQVFLWFLGWGLIVADAKDYKNILKRLGLGVEEEKPPEPT